MTAKDKICFMEETECNPVDCPYAKGHFDRVNDAVYEIIQEEQGITRETILAYAEKYQVCPFELCLDISSWVDGIICDYNYVFDPDASLRGILAMVRRVIMCFLWMKHITLWTEQEKCTAQC